MSLINTLELVTAQIGGTDGNALMGMLPIILMFVILYFLMIRPQMKRQKEHKNMVAAMAKGDEIITTGGILGKVTKVSDNYITAEVSQLGDKPVEVILQRTAVTSVLPKGTIKAL
ncbi:preprotein translocase subunit YajC [Eoetvoesiella caeni]|uniref:Sec translocon accessory complex subunit YajC n=1 Tax=Eoetvoesiella caeni TaxID=645616 RepID=A0A366HB03_9BURK|nr:preprotein translocase subunit YajC [Eoetvoesiella caeni]MCI2809238.1 preprotein translocase subunit YajC [Eoetvoesiella caeni]NYT54378.1 preprotein translocase subunit YajC [Eoetvoesiella caeni]RBP39434.1 protein translocase subunit yajC [Eoetvoesiella caeni]